MGKQKEPASPEFVAKLISDWIAEMAAKLRRLPKYTKEIGRRLGIEPTASEGLAGEVDYSQFVAKTPGGQ